MHTFNNVEELSNRQQEDMLDDLEVRCQTNVASVRDIATSRIHTSVEIRNGNACDRGTVLASVQTSEIGTTGMTGIAKQPVMVGSLFHLQFEEAAELPAILAVCDRCTMLSDTSFELRFRFTQPIQLAGN